MAPKRVAPKPVPKKTAAARTAGGPSYFSTANRQAKERAEQQRGVLAQVRRLPADPPTALGRPLATPDRPSTADAPPLSLHAAGAGEARAAQARDAGEEGRGGARRGAEARQDLPDLERSLFRSGSALAFRRSFDVSDVT